MINKLYDNCFTTELNTKVVEIREDNGMYWYACKDTIFYKESGGMASDIGMINEHLVQDLEIKDGYLWHLLDVKLEDESVFMSVNLHERFRKCQIHTAQHLISAALGNVYKVETLAHHVGDDDNDIEFDFDEFNDKMAFELQVLCNGLIRDDLEVSIHYPTRIEAKKLMKKNIDRDDARVVRIGALDYNLCGCMHVPSLRYLQMIYISGYEKTTKGYKVKYLVGDQLLDCTARRYRVLDEVSKSLAVSHLYASTGVHRLLNETKQLNRDVTIWKQKYYELFGNELGKSEETVIVHFFDDIDIKSLSALAQYITVNYQKAVILIAKVYDNVHVVAASHEAIDFDTEKVFKEIADKFHLKGGGTKKLSQGGGIYNEEILTFINSRTFQ